MTLQDLHAPFPPSEIEWRVGSTNQDKTSGLALAYLNARHVMERLDSVCGAENWQDRYEVHGSKTICYLSIRIGTEWVTKADGAGDSDVEAEKGALSDALKRAAVKWGIGRYLYTLGSTWVDVEPAGKSVRIKKDQYAKLERVLQQRFGMGLETPTDASCDEGTPVSDSTAKLIFPALQSEIMGCSTLEQITGAWNRWLPVLVNWSELMQQNCHDVYSACRERLEAHAGDARGANREVIEADLRASVSEADLNTKWSGWGPAMKKLAPADVAKLQGVAREVKAAATKPASAATPDFTNLTVNDIDKTERMAKLANTP